VVCALLAGAAAYRVSSTRPKSYTATAVLAVASPDVLAQLNGEVAPISTDVYDQDASTIAALVNQPAVRDETATALHRRLTPAQLSSALQVAVQNGTNLVDVSATAKSAGLAAAAANAAATTFLALRHLAQVEDNLNAQAQIRSQLQTLGPSNANSQEGALLDQRLRAVEARATVGTDTSLAQSAEALSATTSPLPKRDAIVGLLAGAILGLAIALTRAHFDDRIHDAREFRGLWDLPLIGSIPKTRQLGRTGRSVPRTEIFDAFSLARTNLRHLHVGTRMTTLMVTSAVSGEGKTTSAWQLVIAARIAGLRALLIEADLRSPDLARRLAMKPSAGLRDLLAGSADLYDVVVPVPLSDRGGEAAPVDVIFAGAARPNPIALLEGGTFRQVLNTVRERYDLVLIDAPPASVADTLVIAGQADGVLIVGRPGVPTRLAFLRLEDHLKSTGVPVVGILINGSDDDPGYGSHPDSGLERAGETTRGGLSASPA
jgi:succinoglycan biosynthesis transport protein ExoP